MKCTVAARHHLREPTPQHTAAQHAALIARLQDHHIFIAGNSVARHWAFVLLALLESNGTTPGAERFSAQCAQGGKLCVNVANRDVQKAHCGSGTIGMDGDPNACHFVVGRNTTITFGWQQRVHDANSALLSTMERLRPDVAILGAGADDIYDPKRTPTWRETQVREAPLLLADLRLFASRHPCTRLYWRTLTPNCFGKFDCCKKPAALNVTNSMLNESSALVRDVLCSGDDRRSSAAEQLTVLPLDEWAANRCPEYDDHVHHSKLSFEFVQAFLEDYTREHSSSSSRSECRTSASTADLQPPPAPPPRGPRRSHGMHKVFGSGDAGDGDGKKYVFQ